MDRFSAVSRPGFTHERATAAIAPTYRALLESEIALYKLPGNDANRFRAKRLLLISGSQGRPIVQLSAKQPLLIMMTTAALVLLAACANLASLLAARGEARQGKSPFGWRLVQGGGALAASC